MSRWLRLFVPDPEERKLFPEPVVVGEAPRPDEVRGATLQETGLFGRKALPVPKTEEDR